MLFARLNNLGPGTQRQAESVMRMFFRKAHADMLVRGQRQ